MTHTLHWQVKADARIEGLDIPIESKSGTKTITDMQEVMANSGLQEGLKDGLAVPDGHAGDEIKWSGTLFLKQILPWLEINVEGEFDVDVWITEDAPAVAVGTEPMVVSGLSTTVSGRTIETHEPAVVVTQPDSPLDTEGDANPVPEDGAVEN